MLSVFEEKYDMGEEVGRGSYAIVYKCTHRATGKVFAAKVAEKSKMQLKSISDINHEIKMMQAVGQHQFIVQLHEFFDMPSSIILILDLIEGGALFDRIVGLKHYSEAQASKLVKNFLLALEHIHSRGIMHRDLKPENLLLRKKTSETEEHLTNVVIADFGLAGRIPDKSCCGTAYYISPEMIKVGFYKTEKQPYDGKCDIWSLGVITYILLSGCFPFSDYSRKHLSLFKQILSGQWSFEVDIWDHISDCAKSFIKAMLTSDPKSRPSATEALKHPWVATVQPNVHLGAQIENIKKFNAQRKLRAALNVFRAASAFGGGAGYTIDSTPPFMRYLSHDHLLSTVVESASQTDPNKIHFIDYSKAMDREQPGWQLQQCCTCGSLMVCRHIQNVHEYLFVGSRDYNEKPLIDRLCALEEEAENEVQKSPDGARLKASLAEIQGIIRCANVFHEEYLKVSPEQMKANLMVASPASSWR